MLLMIDNYDSFTYNLVQYFLEPREEVLVVVKRNDEITINEIEKSVISKPKVGKSVPSKGQEFFQ